MEELISQLLSSVRGIWNYRWLAEVPGLPAGRANQHATELPASQAMRLLLDEIAGRYSDRIVIVDAPPLPPTSEAGVLAGQMGQVGPETASETTTERAVKEALRRFDHCPRISLVCNKTRAFPGDDDDGHYD